MKRTALMAAIAALLAGTAQAAITEMTIFKQPNFQGPSHTIKGEVANLEGGFAREASSAVVKGGNWEVCTDTHFKGSCHVLAPGEYARLDRNLDRRIVSVRFLGADDRVARRDTREDRPYRDDASRYRGYAQGSVDLYGRPGFRGRSVRVERNATDLWDHRFDGRASSAIVNEGTWQLCTEPGFEGICRVYRPGQYEHLAELDDRVSSLRRVR
jgi:hypothetical protein